MIPKIIHFFWFGKKPKGKQEKKCIESWKKYCPDYEIKEWNESNVDLNMMPFVKEAYDAKKYAFVSDVLRLRVLYDEGGIYFDTDVELLKNFDDLLQNAGFIGFENNNFVNTGQCVGAEKGNPIIKEMFDYYKSRHFLNKDGSFNLLGCPIVNTKILTDRGLILNGEMQNIDGFLVLPSDYFNPYDDTLGKLNKTKNTYSIHWYSKSWMSKKTILRSKLSKPLHRMQNKIKR